MSRILDTRTQIVELIKTENSRQDISKSLKVNRSELHQRKDQEESRIWQESNVSYGIMLTVLRKNLKMSPFKHVKTHQLSAQVVDKRLQRLMILLSPIQDDTLPNLVFSDEKKFDFEHHFNTQNDRVWLMNEDEGSRVGATRQCSASVMVSTAVTQFFFNKG